MRTSATSPRRRVSVQYQVVGIDPLLAPSLYLSIITLHPREKVGGALSFSLGITAKHPHRPSALCRECLAMVDGAERSAYHGAQHGILAREVATVGDAGGGTEVGGSTEVSGAAQRALDPLMLEARIRAYASFGHHRTGWPADDRTTAWLIDELRAAGIEAASERFRFRRVEVRSAALSWDDERIQGEPLYDGGFTPTGGVIGELTEPGDAELFGKMVLTPADDPRWTGPEARTHLEALADQGVIGAVVPTADPLGELSLRNAEDIQRPLALPVLQMARRDLRRLGSMMLMRREATLEIDADRLDSVASNVVATIPGDGSAAPLVVMTPKSGWYACAGERGGGLAAWLAIAEAVASTPSRTRTVHFVATSGHELNRAGLRSYLREHAGLTADAACWVHLGASIGAMEASMRLGASDAALQALAMDSLATEQVGTYEVLAPGNPGFGEARELRAAGGRFITVHGRHPFFHSPNDTFDVAVDPEAVARWTRAAWRIVCALLTARDDEE
jgi:hypothetical protein